MIKLLGGEGGKLDDGRMEYSNPEKGYKIYS